MNQTDYVNGFEWLANAFRFDIWQMKQTLFITGTDTGVGKTVLTALLVKFLRERGRMRDGGAQTGLLRQPRRRAETFRGDGRRAAQLALDEINPWHFRAAIAPLLAARLEKKSVKLPQVLAQIRAMQKRFDVLLVEGAGGLLSPLGENFNSRDLILKLRATPIIVAPNKLGAINHILLTLEALPENLRKKARVVLMSPQKPDAATKSNAKLLAEFFPAERIFTLPSARKKFRLGKNSPRATWEFNFSAARWWPETIRATAGGFCKAATVVAWRYSSGRQYRRDQGLFEFFRLRR